MYTVTDARFVKSLNTKILVDDPEWQAIRLSLVGHWIKDHESNVKTLRTYFENNKENPWAVRRVLNVLTGSVHRSKKTAGQASTDQLRKDVRIQWRKMLNETYDATDYRYVTGEI